MQFLLCTTTFSCYQSVYTEWNNRFSSSVFELQFCPVARLLNFVSKFDCFVVSVPYRAELVGGASSN